MSTVDDLSHDLCRQLMLYVNIGRRDTESAKHDPLKLVTLIYETQDGAIVDIVPKKISLCREIVFQTEMWARLVLQQCQHWWKNALCQQLKFYVKLSTVNIVSTSNALH